MVYLGCGRKALYFKGLSEIKFETIIKSDFIRV